MSKHKIVHYFLGDLTVEQRLAVLDRFRAGLEKVLITTNVLSRGNYIKITIFQICIHKKHKQMK